MKKSTVADLAGAASIGLGLAVALGTPAVAASHGDGSHKGTCSATSSVKLKASDHKKGIKVAAQVKTDVAGEVWDWSISDNGVVVASDSTATGKNGKLVVRATVANPDGTDTIDFLASDTVTGESCMAEAVVG